MQDFYRSAWHTTYTTARLVWNHLFKVIAVFALAMTVFLTISYYWVVFSPTDNYLRYDELSVADVEQGKRAVATVCYEVNERHSAVGEAVFYVENQKGEKVYDSQVDFDFTLSGGSPCEQEYIPTQSLEPGMYYLHLIRTIRVQTLVPFTEPVEKKADIAASDTFTVREKSFSQAEMNEAIGDINERINALNKKIQSMQPGSSSAPAQSQRSTQRLPSPTSQQAQIPSTPTTTPQQPRPVIEPKPSPVPSPRPTPTPGQPVPEQRGLMGGALNGVNDLVLNVIKGIEEAI